MIGCFQPDKINVKQLERICGELIRWNLRIEDTGKVARLAGESIFKELKRISSERENLRRLQRLNRIFPLLSNFNIEPNLHNTQNLYFEISMENKKESSRDIDKDWIEQFNLLGDNLGVKVE